MTLLVAADLDRTLIYSRSAIGAGDHASDVRCVEALEGRPQSFMTERAWDWLAQVRSHALLVPATTRTLAQYERVRLPGGPAPYAVISNGGHLLVDGVQDPDWSGTVRDRINGSGAALAEIVDGLDRFVAGRWVLSRRIADDLFCYLVVDVPSVPHDFLRSWTGWCADRGWVVSRQGRKIYALPDVLTKQAALAEVMRRVGASRLIAAGDGALDAGMLSMADDAIRPAHGELADTGWQQQHVRITANTGLLAGEEIGRWLALQVRP